MIRCIVKVIQFSKSVGVRIPMDILRESGIKLGDRVMITYDHGSIIITKEPE